MYKSYSMELAGRTLTVDIGRVCAQANGAALMHSGDTTVLSTCTASAQPRDGIDFFPLQVEYEEKMYAVGQFPGGFKKREGRASDNAILTSRVIDRPMRPLFPKDFRNDVLLDNLVMSVDQDCSPELLAMLGSSLATAISNVPWDGPCASTQVGMINGEFIINPTNAEKTVSDLNLTVASTRDKVIMIEAGANCISDDQMIEAIYKADEINKQIISFFDSIIAECGKEKTPYESYAVPQALFDKIKSIVPEAEMENAVFTDDKQQRDANMAEVTRKLEEALADDEDALQQLPDAVYQYEKGKRVYIVTPQIGKKEKLVELAITNAGILMNRYRQQYREQDVKNARALEELQQLIGLPALPLRIESYDISNTMGALNVGSMVVYQNGRPKNNDYRKFRIQSVQGPDDVRSMREMLTRRFEHGLSEMQSNARDGKDDKLGSFSNFPDLICMDGGKGQVHVCEEVLQSLGITSITVVGMVKDDHHRTRALLYQDEELPIAENSEAFKLLTRIQDEVHRFAISYHRSLREQKQIRSLLDDIKGIGEVRKKALMRRFGDIDHIRVAGLEELRACPSMDEYSARQVYDFFHRNPETAVGTWRAGIEEKA